MDWPKGDRCPSNISTAEKSYHFYLFIPHLVSPHLTRSSPFSTHYRLSVFSYFGGIWDLVRLERARFTVTVVCRDGLPNPAWDWWMFPFEAPCPWSLVSFNRLFPFLFWLVSGFQGGVDDCYPQRTFQAL